VGGVDVRQGGFAMTLILYGVPLSPFYRKVEMLLGEKSVSFQAEMVNILPMPDWFKEISPAQRIPVLRDTELGTEGSAGTIPDSSAICAYLEEKHPEPALYPRVPFERGRALWYEEYADSEMAAAIGMGIFRPIMFPRFQGKEPDLPAARKTWQEKLPRLFDYLEGELAGRAYLVGEGLSIADIAVGCQFVNLSVVAGLPDAARWPTLVAYVEKLLERPSIAANLAICRKIVKQPVDLSS